jgi:hypothetical protein
MINIFKHRNALFLLLHEPFLFRDKHQLLEMMLSSYLRLLEIHMKALAVCTPCKRFLIHINKFKFKFKSLKLYFRLLLSITVK